MPSSSKRPQNKPMKQQRAPDKPAEQNEPTEFQILHADLERNRDIYADLLGGDKPAEKSKVDRFLVMAYQAVWHNPNLLEANRDSLLLAFAEAAAVGLSLNPTAKEAYIETRGSMARFGTQYQGLIKLMHRGNDIDYLHVDVVRRGDFFRQVGGSDPHIEHVAIGLGEEPDDYDSDDAILAAYAVVKTRGASRAVHEVARRSEILRARAMSKGRGGAPPSPAWAAWFGRMAMKLPLRRLANRLPNADDARMISSIEDAQARGEDVTLDRVAQVFRGRGAGLGGPKAVVPSQPDELAALMASSFPTVTPRQHERWQQAVSAFSKFDVSHEQLLEHLGRTRVGDTTDEDHAKLKAAYERLRGGESVDDVFGQVDEPEADHV